LPENITVKRDADEVLLAGVDDDQAVLRLAVQAGEVEHFGWQQPTLTDIFREAVA
jgi:ABC-2 type transport system ATP-binding protein